MERWAVAALRGGGRGGRRRQAHEVMALRLVVHHHAQQEELTHAGTAKQVASGGDNAYIHTILQGPPEWPG